jgi:hypothetical protein
MALDLAVMRKRLEKKQAEIQQHIAVLTGSCEQPEDAIQASDGVVELEEGQWISSKRTWIKLFSTKRKHCLPKCNRHWHASRMGVLATYDI